MGTVGTGQRVRPLTDLQRDVLAFIHRTLVSKGRPPTQKQIGDLTGATRAAGHFKIESLEARGLIERVEEGPNRGILITAKGYHVLGESSPNEMRLAVAQSDTYRGLLVRSWALLTQMCPPDAPLLGDIRDALSVDEKIDAAKVFAGATS